MIFQGFICYIKRLFDNSFKFSLCICISYLKQIKAEILFQTYQIYLLTKAFMSLIGVLISFL